MHIPRVYTCKGFCEILLEPVNIQIREIIMRLTQSWWGKKATSTRNVSQTKLQRGCSAKPLKTPAKPLRYPRLYPADAKQYLPHILKELYTCNTSKLSGKFERFYTKEKHSKCCPDPSVLSLWPLAPPVPKHPVAWQLPLDGGSGCCCFNSA